MIRKAIRTAQNFFPALGETKNDVYHWSRKTFGLIHDPDFAALAGLPLSYDDLFLDVGANRGQSILSMRRFRPEAQIVSFEPNPLMFRWLEGHFRDQPGVRLANYGLSDRAGSRRLYVPHYRGFTYDGLATFSRETAEKYLSSDTLFGFDPALLTLDIHVCQARTLDSLKLSPTFIKIDVEGCEHEVLAGGVRTLRACQPVLMVERFYPNDALADLLDDLGYVEVEPCRGGFRRGETDRPNMFCMTPARLATCATSGAVSC